MSSKKHNKSYWLILILLSISLLLGINNLRLNYALKSKLDATSQKLDTINGREDLIRNKNQPLASQTRSKEYKITKSVPIVAVSEQGQGTIGNLTLQLIPGNNNVLINTDPFLETDIQQATNKGVAIAKTRSNYNYDKDFIFKFKMGGAQLVGGNSAGAAIILVTLAALQSKIIEDKVIMTGAINADGSIGRVGGLLKKLQAAAAADYDYFLLPQSQVEFIYYRRKVTKEPSGFGFEFLNTEYVPKTINLKKMAQKKWGLKVIGINNISQAYPYFFEGN